MSLHNCMCDCCKKFPIEGRRWTCTMCLGIDFCDDCFTQNDHKVSHIFKVRPAPKPFNPDGQKMSEHTGVTCDLCKDSPLIGCRWKCLTCEDFDLCNLCYATDSHPTEHQFIRHLIPGQEVEEFPLRAPLRSMDPELFEEVMKQIEEIKIADEARKNIRPKLLDVMKDVKFATEVEKKKKEEEIAAEKKRLEDQKAAEEAAREKELEGFTEFEIAGLKRHNELRARHGVQMMKLDRKLCNLASDWARQMAARGGLSHRPSSGSSQGENCYAMFDPRLTSAAASKAKTAIDAIDAWYNEIRYYRFGYGGFSAQTGHFTAVVWKATNRMGIGAAMGRNGVYVCANYLPAGNMMGQFNNNVFKPK